MVTSVTAHHSKDFEILATVYLYNYHGIYSYHWACRSGVLWGCVKLVGKSNMHEYDEFLVSVNLPLAKYLIVETSVSCNEIGKKEKMPVD